MKYLLFLLPLALSFTARPQKVIYIVFSNTRDGEIKEGCVMDEFHFNDYAERVSQALGYEPEPIDYSGDRFTTGHFDGLLQDIQSDPDDILLFYISCHGARGRREKIKYPQVVINGKYRSVFQLYQEMRKLPHRTLLFVIDACNVKRDISTEGYKVYKKSFSPDFSNAISSVERENTRTIFVDHHFDLIVTSSQPDVSSISTPTGSVFTNCLLSSLNYYARNQNEPCADIRNIIARTKDHTFAVSSTFYLGKSITSENQPHYPVWDFIPPLNFNFLVDKNPTLEFDLSYTIQTLKSASSPSGSINKLKVNILTDSAMLDSIKSVKYYFSGALASRGEAPIEQSNPSNNFETTKLTNASNNFLVAELSLKNGSVYYTYKKLILNNRGLVRKAIPKISGQR
jgi:hypothetical protein